MVFLLSTVHRRRVVPIIREDENEYLKHTEGFVTRRPCLLSLPILPSGSDSDSCYCRRRHHRGDS